MRGEARSLWRIGKNTVALLSAQAWARLLSMVLVALVARVEGAEGLGRYLLVLTIVGIAGALADAGLNIYLTREVARAADPTRERELLGTVLPLKAGLAIAGASALVVLAAVAPFPPATASLIPLGGLLLLTEAPIGAMRAFVNARQRMEVSSVIDMVIRLVALLVAIPALNAGLGISGVLACTIGASLLGIVAYILVLQRWQARPHYQWSAGAWRACLAESYPFAVTSIAAMLYARFDLVLLGLWQGEVAVGWYGAAYKLWETIGMLPGSLFDAMFPEMSRLSGARQGKEKLRRLFRASTWLMLAGGLVLALLGALLAEPLLSLIYGSQENYAAAVLPFQLLVGASPAMFLYLLSGHTLYALDRQRRVTAAMLLVGVVNITLNLIVIPRWGYIGCAAVALLSEWLLCGLLYPQARRAFAAD